MPPELTQQFAPPVTADAHPSGPPLPAELGGGPESAASPLGPVEASSAVSPPARAEEYRTITDPVLQTRIFRFHFGRAVLALVRERFVNLPRIGLVDLSVDARGSRLVPELRVADYPGFYQLFRNDDPVYVGRAASIAKRLAQHRKRLQGRVALAEMQCRFLVVEDPSLIAISEQTMISYFGETESPWQTLGFGSNATGVGRLAQESKWYAQYPPDLSYEVTVGGEWRIPRTGPNKGYRRKELTLRQLVLQIAKGAPVTLSIPRKQKRRFDEAHPGEQLEDAKTGTFASWIELLEARLQADWRVERRPMAWYIMPADVEVTEEDEIAALAEDDAGASTGDTYDDVG